MVDLESVGEQLYAVLPADFVAARKSLAAQAKESGDVELAKAVARLPKPTAAAWVVNVLVRHRPDEVEQVLALGESLRTAQQDLDADQLRELTKQRRRLTAEVTRSARSVAAELGNPVSSGVGEQVESTLHAAMVDAGAADAVRAGQLTEPLRATGFGAVDVRSAMATGRTPAGARVTPSKPQLSVVPDDTRAREEAQERAALAADALRAAEDAAARASQRSQQVTARSLELAERLEELRRQVAEREHELEVAEDEVEEAEAAQQVRDEALADARAEVKAAGRALDALT